MLKNMTTQRVEGIMQVCLMYYTIAYMVRIDKLDNSILWGSSNTYL